MAVTSRLEKEFKYYLANQEDFIKKYNDKYLVIKDEEIIGVYDTELQAYNETQKVHELGSFLIQLCSPGKSGYTQTFHSRVSFN